MALRCRDKQRRFADAVYRSGETLLEIINDILDFSKIEAGKFELESVDFNLRTMVEDVFEMLAPRAHQKRIELASRIGPEVPTIAKGDPTRIRQVLTNLVGNALKFTETGEIVVTVSAEPEDGRHRVRFEVRDTGIGLRAEALQRLFTVFMQADQSMSRRYGGTGLGLAISKQLVELMGGSISVESQFGEGSTFRFDVPLASGDTAAVASPVNLQQLRGRRVILVEDNPTNRSILEMQLQDGRDGRCDCRPWRHRAGTDARRRARQHTVRHCRHRHEDADHGRLDDGGDVAQRPASGRRENGDADFARKR